MTRIPSQRPPAPKLDRDRPFEFQHYLSDDTADWLELATAQRNLMRGLLDVCGGTRKNRLAPAQTALVDFAAEASMLEMLNAEQRTRLEGDLNRPLSGVGLAAKYYRTLFIAREPSGTLQTIWGLAGCFAVHIGSNFARESVEVTGYRHRLDEPGPPWDVEQQWLWSNLPFMLRLTGNERVERRGFLTENL